jgi:hypothetical protein
MDGRNEPIETMPIGPLNDLESPSLQPIVRMS